MSENAGAPNPPPGAPHFLTTLEQAVVQYPRIVDVASSAVGSGLRAVYLVGCGGARYATMPAHYLLERETTGLIVSHITSAEFAYAPPSQLGPATLVAVCSHTGATPETIAAARRAKDAGATVAAVTSAPTSELARTSDVVLAYPETRTIFEPQLTMFIQLGYALLEQLGVPNDYRVVRDAFQALPAALQTARKEINDVAWQLVTSFANEPLIYVIGAGPGYAAACAFARNYLQEMQWMQAIGLNAGDFLHGPVEAVTEETPVVVLLGEDESRPITERVLAFANGVSTKSIAIDTRPLSLPGVPADLRPGLSAIVLGSMARRMLDYFVAVRGHDPSSRRYMGTSQIP